MRENLQFFAGKSMWRWLFLTLLLSGIVSQNFAEPKSVYRIEEVVSNAKYESICRKIASFQHFFENTDQTATQSKTHQLQHERLRFLSRILQLRTELAVLNAPNLQPVLMRATGHYLKSRPQSSEKPFHLFS